MKTKLLLFLAVFMFIKNINAQMILNFDTNLSSGTTISIPLFGAVDVSVDWGDGNTEPFTTEGNKSHTYSVEGTYTVTITGSLTHFGSNGSELEKLTSVTSWSGLGLTNLSYAFYGARRLTEVPNSIPSTVTNMSYMFRNAYVFNHDIGNWDVSNVTLMHAMFWCAYAFNQDIGSWVVSNVTTMSSMFYYAEAFNQDIGSWDIGNVTSLNTVFDRAEAFNQDIGSWDVSNITQMYAMFRNAYAFDQDIGGWDVSNVTDIREMFSNVTLSTVNYDSLLIGWSGQTLQAGRDFHGGNSQYSCAAKDARVLLTGSPNNWAITDGGLFDETDPVPDVATLSNVTAECEVTSLIAPTATDNCAGTITGTTTTIFPITAQGTTEVIWTYDDGNDNVITQKQNVIIDDTTNPVPDAATLSDVTAECEVTSLTPPIANDNCNGIITGTHDAIFPITGEGTTTVVTWTYDDGNGNITTQTQNVVIDDVTAPVPVVATLDDVTAECEVTSLTAPTATDNCAGSVEGIHDAMLPITGTTEVTWTYNDGNGNTSTQTQNVIIEDAEAPVPDVAALNEVTAECEVTTLTAPTATDNCAGTITGTTTTIFPITAQGTTEVTWTYNDGNGNDTIQTQNVIIEDVTDPTITCIENQAKSADAGQCYYTVSGTEFDPTETGDNCGIASVVNNINGTSTLAGEQIMNDTEVIWTITDNSYNINTCSFTVTVEDNEDPTITYIENQTKSADAGQCYYTVSGTEFDPTETGDNCGIASVVNNINGTSTLDGEQIVNDTEVIWTIIDNSGNINTCSFTVTVTENIDPTISCVENQTRNADPGQCNVYTVSGTEFDPTAVDDNCGIASVVNNINGTSTLDGEQIPDGTSIVWTITDNSGNENYCSFTVTVVDTEDPTISCVDDQTYTLASRETVYTVTGTILDPVTTNDNCSIANISNDINQLSTLDDVEFSVGITTVTWTVTDEAGKEASCSFDITVNKTTGIKDIEQYGISIYPNPTNGILYIESQQERLKNVEVYDLTGKLILTKTNRDDKEINLSDFGVGIYLVKINTDKKSFTTRIIKE